MSKFFPETIPMFSGYPEAPKANEANLAAKTREYEKKKANFEKPSIFERATKVALTILVLSPIPYKKEAAFALSGHKIAFHRKPTVPMITIVFTAFMILKPVAKGFLADMIELSDNLGNFCTSSRKLVVIVFNGEEGGWNQLWKTAKAAAGLGATVLLVLPGTSGTSRFAAITTNLSLNLISVAELTRESRDDPSKIIEIILKSFFAMRNYNKLQNFG